MPNHPIFHTFNSYRIPFNILVEEYRDFKYGMQVDHSKPTNNISSLKAACQATWTIYNLVGINHISGMAEASVVKFCTQVDYNIQIQPLNDMPPL